MQQQDPGSVLVISSHVVRGAVGNRAAVFALETLGHTVWALPTIILPWHPGHGPSVRIALEAGDFASAAADLARSPHTGELKAALTGYFASADQVRATRDLLVELKSRNPDLVYLCDPVIGDKNGLYVSVAIAEAIGECLLPLADIATPNRFELAWYAKAELDSNQAIAAAALALGPKSVLVTSAIAMMAKSTGNLWVTGHEIVLAEHRLVDNPPNGLGDLLAALFLSRLVRGENAEKALQSATSSVFEILVRSVKRNADELNLPGEASSLATPMAMVQMRKLMHPGRGRKA